jgi:DNA (cytosine-5)-methyltransferase 1
VQGRVTRRSPGATGKEGEDMKPRLLDLFCGAGGAAMGYHRAGFDVVGVDINPQSNYPFPFHCGDALAFMERDIDNLGEFIGVNWDAIHASPPCQAHTTMSNRWRGAGGKADDHVDLIGETRALLEQTRLPWVIENVPGAKGQMRSPVTLDGSMFGLGVVRPRLFESNVLLSPPQGMISRVLEPVGVYGKAHDGRLLWARADGTEQRAARSLKEARTAMGIDWMEWRELAEAIPPAYTEWIGRQLLECVG